LLENGNVCKIYGLYKINCLEFAPQEGERNWEHM
jgi:hypothetical protein